MRSAVEVPGVAKVAPLADGLEGGAGSAEGGLLKMPRSLLRAWMCWPPRSPILLHTHARTHAHAIARCTTSPTATRPPSANCGTRVVREDWGKEEAD
jgi:hypothetical protein